MTNDYVTKNLNFIFWNPVLRNRNEILKSGTVRHVTGTGSGLPGGIPRVVVQLSALTLKGPL